jgi:hypothetical protein
VADPAQIALLSLGTTMGLRTADEALAELVRDAGASCEIVRVRTASVARLRRGMLLTDVAEAYAARRSARGLRSPFVIYSSITTVLLQRPHAPYAVRFDSLAALNRPGLGGSWQRRRERRVLESARLLLPWSEAGARAARAVLQGEPPAIVLPPLVDVVPVERERDVDAVAYAGNPHKRGLELLCAAWGEIASPGLRLVVAGIDPEAARRYLRRAGVAEPTGVEWAGSLPRERWFDLLTRTRVFVNASRYEDWGLAQMEALAAGSLLVSVPSAGLNEALGLARRLAPQLVAVDRTAPALENALRLGLAVGSEVRRDYEQEAASLLVPYRRATLRRTVADEVLPALLQSV